MVRRNLQNCFASLQDLICKEKLKNDLVMIFVFSEKRDSTLDSLEDTISSANLVARKANST